MKTCFLCHTVLQKFSLIYHQPGSRHAVCRACKGPGFIPARLADIEADVEPEWQNPFPDAMVKSMHRRATEFEKENYADAVTKKIYFNDYLFKPRTGIPENDRPVLQDALQPARDSLAREPRTEADGRDDC